MKRLALLGCSLLLVGCSAATTDAASDSDAPSTTAATSFSSRGALEVSDDATCQTLIGTDGGLVSESGQFLIDVSELSDATASDASGIADALKGVAGTSSEELRDLLTVMQEPFRDLMDAHDNGDEFTLDPSRFKAAGNEVIAICEPLIEGSTEAEATVDAAAEAKASAEAEATAAAEATAEAEASASAEAKATAAAAAEAAARAGAEAAAAAEATAKAEADAAAGTVSQRNALRAAADYLDFKPFSLTGLVSQLEYEEYSTEDATWAVERVSVDWNEQAAQSAKDYLEYKAFSRAGLIDQLVYEGFTPEQAEYGVTQTGL